MTWRRFEVGALAAAAATCVLLATDAIPDLRGPETWRWGRRVLEPGAAAFAILASGALFAGSAALALRARRTWGAASGASRASLVAGAAALIFLQMLALTAAEPGGLSNLARRVKDPAFTSYHTIAASIEDPRAFLRDYDRLQSRFPVHGPSQPPGRVLFFWGVNLAAGNPERGALPAALLLLAAGALCVAPLAVLAGGRCDPTSTGAALLLFSCVPSILLFTPETDHLILLLTMSAAALLFEAIRRGTGAGRATGHATAAAIGAAILAGFVAGAALFVSFTSAAALGAWGIALAGNVAYAPAEARPRPGRLVAIAAAACAGLLAALAIPAALGMDWPAVVRQSVEGAYRIQVLIFRRTFAEWVGRNLVDFALFLGPPLAFAVLARAGSEMRAFAGRRQMGAASDAADAAAPTSDSTAAPPFALALLAAILVLDLSGKILGETGRIWMFLMPLAVLAAAGPAGRSPRALLILAGSQFAVLVTLRLVLDVPG